MEKEREAVAITDLVAATQVAAVVAAAMEAVGSCAFESRRG